jgi:hypothetical protein
MPAAARRSRAISGYGYGRLLQQQQHTYMHTRYDEYELVLVLARDRVLEPYEPYGSTVGSLTKPTAVVRASPHHAACMATSES